MKVIRCPQCLGRMQFEKQGVGYEMYYCPACNQSMFTDHTPPNVHVSEVQQLADAQYPRRVDDVPTYILSKE